MVKKIDIDNIHLPLKGFPKFQNLTKKMTKNSFFLLTRLARVLVYDYSNFIVLHVLNRCKIVANGL